MFSYYGSKSKIIQAYPKPKHNKIIEPFAGSARYALRYFENDITINDKYEVIARIWKFLQSCSPQDIKRLPEPKRKEDIRQYQFDCEEAQMLMCFMIGGGLSRMQWIVSPQNFGAGVATQKKKIIAQLHKIKHWKITCVDYQELPNTSATWFIDAPYQYGGHKYVVNKIDYSVLSDWCKSREGQLIVCENTKADWLPFMPIKKVHGSTFKTTEAIYTNYPTVYDNIQQTINFLAA